jgi:hypothetical protein
MTHLVATLCSQPLHPLVVVEAEIMMQVAPAVQAVVEDVLALKAQAEQEPQMKVSPVVPE